MVNKTVLITGTTGATVLELSNSNWKVISRIRYDRNDKIEYQEEFENNKIIKAIK